MFYPARTGSSLDARFFYLSHNLFGIYLGVVKVFFKKIFNSYLSWTTIYWSQNRKNQIKIHKVLHKIFDVTLFKPVGPTRFWKLNFEFNSNFWLNFFFNFFQQLLKTFFLVWNLNFNFFFNLQFIYIPV